jgi:hypothetical protein
MPIKRKSKKRKPNRLRKAFYELYQYSVGNRGSREGNPYLKPEVAKARKLLGDK